MHDVLRLRHFSGHLPLILFILMPGSSVICGVLPCSNARHVYEGKLWTVTFDTEIVIACEDIDNVVTVPAAVQHFVGADESRPQDETLHFVYGKIASIDSTIPLGEGVSADDYDFFIDADVVRIFYHCICSLLPSFPSRCTLFQTTSFLSRIGQSL